MLRSATAENTLDEDAEAGDRKADRGYDLSIPREALIYVASPSTTTSRLCTAARPLLAFRLPAKVPWLSAQPDERSRTCPSLESLTVDWDIQRRIQM